MCLTKEAKKLILIKLYNLFNKLDHVFSNSLSDILELYPEEKTDFLDKVKLKLYFVIFGEKAYYEKLCKQIMYSKTYALNEICYIAKSISFNMNLLEEVKEREEVYFIDKKLYFYYKDLIKNSNKCLDAYYEQLLRNKTNYMTALVNHDPDSLTSLKNFILISRRIYQIRYKFDLLFNKVLAEK